MNENDYTSLTTPLALRSVDSRAASRSTVGSRCPEAWPFVASLVDSTQESICYERAPCSWYRPISGRTGGGVMQVLYPCCCGLDIHKKFVVACVLRTAPDGSMHKQTRTFSTMTG